MDYIRPHYAGKSNISVFSTARLETRTKEFELPASESASRKHQREMKVIVVEFRFHHYFVVIALKKCLATTGGLTTSVCDRPLASSSRPERW